MVNTRGLRITFFVLNLRLGGQVSNLMSLEELLRERGLHVRWSLPKGMESLDKSELIRFSDRDAWTRARAMLRCLRRLPSSPGEVVHMVLPTASFTPICAFARTPKRRILVQSEGLPMAFDREHVALLRASPALLLPRMLLNNRRLVRAARHMEVAQLVTSPSYAKSLRALGFGDVSCVENIARFARSDNAPLPPELLGLFSSDRTVAGYIGHAHAVKGVDDLIEGFQLASTMRPDLHLLLALSPDGNAQRIRRHVARLPATIRERVHFAGVVPVRSLLTRLDALMLPYRSIATTTIFPSLLLEADAAGCPVIVCDVEPLEDILPASGGQVVRVAARSPARLARALGELGRRHGASAPLRLKLPSEEERVERLLAVYERLASA